MLDEASEPELEAAPPTVKRNIEHLREYASREPEGKPRAIRLRFYTSPTAILGDEKVEAIEVVRNELVDGRAVATDDRETIPCGIVFRSVGYRGTPIEGLPFDEGSCTVPNDGGRVLGGDGLPLAGVYCAGWIKRGPSGVIGTNKKDATETVERLIADAAQARSITARPRPRSTRCSRNAASGSSPRRAGRRSTRGESAGEPHGRPASSSPSGTRSSTRPVSTAPPAELPRRGRLAATVSDTICCQSTLRTRPCRPLAVASARDTPRGLWSDWHDIGASSP